MNLGEAMFAALVVGLLKWRSQSLTKGIINKQYSLIFRFECELYYCLLGIRQ